MNVWKYIDKTVSTITIMQDYSNMREIINITPQEIKDLYAQMISPRSSRITGMPNTHSPHSGEESLVKSLDQLDILQERYRQAIEYMTWFEPAWSTLSDDEQKVLREFYMNGNQRSGANAKLQAKLNYGESHIERMRSKALSRLSIMLFGK